MTNWYLNGLAETKVFLVLQLILAGMVLLFCWATGIGHAWWFWRGQIIGTALCMGISQLIRWHLRRTER